MFQNVHLCSEHNKPTTNWPVFQRTEHLISHPLVTVNIASNVPVHRGDATIPRRGDWESISACSGCRWRHLHSCTDNDPSVCLGSWSHTGTQKWTLAMEAFSLPVIVQHFSMKALLLWRPWVMGTAVPYFGWLELQFSHLMCVCMCVQFLTDKRDDWSCHRHTGPCEWLVFSLCICKEMHCVYV